MSIKVTQAWDGVELSLKQGKGKILPIHLQKNDIRTIFNEMQLQRK